MNDYINPRENYIHPTALIAPGVKMGTGNYIGPFCIIGYPAEHKTFWGKDQKGVEIGNDNILTGHITIDAGTEHPTSLGDSIWMLKHSHVGHDAVIGNHATISCGAKVGGHAIIGPATNIGLNACIHQWVDVPEGCMIGMNAAVTKKTALEPFRKYAGVPAKDIGSNVKQAAVSIHPELKLIGMSTNRVGKAIPKEVPLLEYELRTHPGLQILGKSGEKTIFVLKGNKTSPVMIYHEKERKVYTSGLGLICPDMDTLKVIFKLLGYEISG